MTTEPKMPCKIWPGKLESRTGYGRKKVAGKAWMAHRWAYQEFYGDLSDDMVVDHICFNRGCVEPTHLRQIAREENSARHKPECPCSSCSPLSHRAEVCKSGHDISQPEQRGKPRGGTGQGSCRLCHSERQRKYRAAKKAAR